MNEPKKKLSLALIMLSIAGGSTAACRPAPPPEHALYTIINGDPHRQVEVPNIAQEEWTLSRTRLTQLRRELPRKPYVERVQIGVVDPRTGQLFSARGAVAVSPYQAARLILIGPGGTTALDVWVTRDRYRFEIPSIHLQKRGGADLSQARGLPIGFLRWWFLGPLDGELVLARSSPGEAAFLFRDGPATVTMRTDGEKFVAIRREAGRVEGLEWSGRGLIPHAGSRGKYLDGEWGMRVFIVVEEVLTEEPDPAAFLDPDLSGGGGGSDNNNNNTSKGSTTL